MAKKSRTFDRIDIPLSELDLDFRNPRLDRDDETNSLDAIHSVIDDGPEDIVGLALSIAKDGLDPGLSLLVMRSDNGRYVVLEGNRRVTALRLLQNPELANGSLTSGQKSRIRNAAKGMVDIEPISCVVYATREDADAEIERRHTGKRDGDGVVQWGPIEQARFSRRRGDHDPTMDVLQFLLDHGELPQEVRRKARDGRFFTNLARMIEDEEVRPLLGIEVARDRALTRLGKDEVIKGLRRLFLDALEGRYNSRTMNDSTARVDWVAKKMSPLDRPAVGAPTSDSPVRLADAPATRGQPKPQTQPAATTGSGGGSPAATTGPAPSEGTGPYVADQGSLGHTTQAQQPPRSGGEPGRGAPDGADDAAPAGPGKGGAPPNGKRKHILAGPLYVDHPSRANDIYEELRKVDLIRYPNAVAVLFRVFVELSVDAYCDRAGISKVKSAKGDRVVDLTLKEKVTSVCERLVTEGGKEVKDHLKSVHLELTAGRLLQGNIEMLHQYVHNQHMSPTHEDLRIAGSRFHPLLKLIWPHRQA